MTSDIRVTRQESVHIDPRHHELYTQLTADNEAPFKTMKDLFMLAANVGFLRGRRVPLTSQREIFRWPVFSSQEDIPNLRAIAIAETGDTTILVDQVQLLMIAEEYANAGIEEVRREVVSHPGTPVDNLVHFLLSTDARDLQ